MIEVKFAEICEQKEFYDGVLKLLNVSDKEFVPPLSERNSTTQSDLSSGAVCPGGVLEYFEELKKQRFMFACEDGKMIAFFSFKENFQNDIIEEKELPNIYISTLIVSPEARGRGISKLMYETLIDNCKNINIFTRTWSTNAAHIKILSKFNFDIFKVLKDDRGDGIDTVYFKRKGDGLEK